MLRLVFASWSEKTFGVFSLRGGGKKRKKKNYSTPKKNKHKKKKVKLAVLKYYKVTFFYLFGEKEQIG